MGRLTSYNARLFFRADIGPAERGCRKGKGFCHSFSNDND